MTDLFEDTFGQQRTEALISIIRLLELQPVILVLVQKKCDPDNLRAFEDYYVQSGKRIPRELPFTRKEACDIFGEESGNHFFRPQSCYTPVIIDEGRHTKIGNSMRAPIICLHPELGKDAYETVYETIVPKGVWRSTSGSRNTSDKLVATKIFDDEDLFDVEVAMYKAI